MIEVTTAPTSRALAAVVGLLRVRADEVEHVTWRTRCDRRSASATFLISMDVTRQAHVCAALRRLVDVIDVQVR
jgi:hypothetical protein